jgi:hypothetical protein
MPTEIDQPGYSIPCRLPRQERAAGRVRQPIVAVIAVGAHIVGAVRSQQIAHSTYQMRSIPFVRTDLIRIVLVNNR